MPGKIIINYSGDLPRPVQIILKGAEDYQIKVQLKGDEEIELFKGKKFSPAKFSKKQRIATIPTKK